MVNFGEFRKELQSCKDQYPHLWASSRAYLNEGNILPTLSRLTDRLRTFTLNPGLEQRLLETLDRYGQDPKDKSVNQALKELTGFPPSKALRALIVWGVLSREVNHKPGSERLEPEAVEACVREDRNPFSLLMHSTTPSVLDIGAGDLTFEHELVDQIIPRLSDKNLPLTLHAFDRLNPSSRVGGVYHTDQERERYLIGLSPDTVQFQFWGGKNLDQFAALKRALGRYTISTCFAPANPTFAFEPSRVRPQMIQDHLRRTRGEFRVDRYGGEPVLEVSHGNSVLTFPEWKFEVLGPLVLLEFMATRSALGVLAAVDDEVFWEIVSQVLEGEQFRPSDVVFTKESLPKVFGPVFEHLTSLPLGERCDLSTVAPLRQTLPPPKRQEEKSRTPFGLRYVEVRRGAELEGMPSSFTAKQFSRMKEESTPWWMIFVPDHEG